MVQFSWWVPSWNFYLTWSFLFYTKCAKIYLSDFFLLLQIFWTKVEIRTNCFDDGYHLEKRNTRRFVTKVSRKWLGSCFKSQCSRNSKLLHQLLHHGKWKVVHVLCGKKGLCRLLSVLPTFTIYNFWAFIICRHQNEYIRE